LFDLFDLFGFVLTFDLVVYVSWCFDISVVLIVWCLCLFVCFVYFGFKHSVSVFDLLLAGFVAE